MGIKRILEPEVFIQSTVTAGGTTTLTFASAPKQYFTGSANQTVVLPVAATCYVGFDQFIKNNSTGTLTINSSGGNLVQTLAAGQSARITCILASGTTAASWDFEVNGFTTAHGCSLYDSSGLATTGGVYFAIPFSNEGFDTDGYHDNVTNNTRITIPAGLAGKYRITASFITQSIHSVSTFLKVKVNGADITTGFGGGQRTGLLGNSKMDQVAGSIDLILSVGDYVEVFGQIDTTNGSDTIDRAFQIAHWGA